MSVGASLKRTLTEWFDTFGTRDARAIGDLVEPSLLRRHGPPACDLCGRRLLLGEPLNRFRRDDDEVVICPVCEPDALFVGYLRLPSDVEPERWYVLEGQVTRVQRPAAAVAVEEPAEAQPAGADPRRGRRRLKRAA